MAKFSCYLNSRLSTIKIFSSKPALNTCVLLFLILIVHFCDNVVIYKTRFTSWIYVLRKLWNGTVSGAVCASTLARNGVSVTIFEPARGPGGRMSQRRLSSLSISLWDKQQSVHALVSLAVDVVYEIIGWTSFVLEYYI